MNIFSKVTDGFIQSFGITAPSESQRKTATIFISTLLLGILAAFLGAATFLILHFVR
jgi:hypothetical protein